MRYIIWSKLWHTWCLIFCLSETRILSPFHTIVSASNGSAEALATVVRRLTGDRPSMILMDNRKLGSFWKYWGKIRIAKEMGSTVFVYKTYLEDVWKPRVKPCPWRSNYRYNISYGWTFVCFLEVSHSKDSLNAYLYKLLIVGNGRTDHFVFIGGRFILRSLLSSPAMRKFRNVIGIETGGFTLVMHYRKTCRNIGIEEDEPFSITTNSSLPTWIPRTENCLSGHKFRMSGTDFPPFMFYHRPSYSKSGKWEYDGISYLLLTNGAEKYNYTISLNHPSQWELMGERQDDGTFDGVFGDLMYGRAEIASVSNPTADRSGLADFIGPFGRSNLVFMSANPLTYADAGEYAIFHPLPYYVWAFLIVGFLFLWVLNSIALEIRHSRGQERYQDTIKRAFMMMMAFTFEQGIRKPKGFPLRLLMIVWVAFMIIIATSYKYNLASYIVTPQPDKVPRTFYRLYDRKEYSIIFDLGGVSGWNYFRTNRDPKIQSLGSRAETTEDTSWCTVKAFMEVSTVCAGWDFSLAFASSKNLTITLGREALYTSQPLFEAWFVFATENNSVFTNEFMKIGRTYFEIGLIAMWEKKILRTAKYQGRKWLSERQDDDLYRQLQAFRTRSSRSILEKLDWKNVQFIFLMFSVGICISCVTFMVEICQGRAYMIKRMFYRKTIKIRKISNIVRRKISGEMLPKGVSEERRSLSIAGEQNPTITVTFLP